MSRLSTVLRAAAVVGACLLLAVSISTTARVEARDRGHRLTGTWVWHALGLTGFYTYCHDGTVTGESSLIHGTGFSPEPGTLFSSDHGIWRRAGRGFEAVVYRMGFDPATGDVVRITRIRTLFEIDHGGQSTSGTFFVTQWDCPTALTCPDPNVDPPTVEEFAPPVNTGTQTRVRIP